MEELNFILYLAIISSTETLPDPVKLYISFETEDVSSLKNALCIFSISITDKKEFGFMNNFPD